MTAYLFGPGRGEAVVVALPDATWLVVDSCMEDGENLPLLLLEHLEVERVALAALTHPDADHYRGFQHVLESVAVDRLWVFPYALTRRTILASLARRNPDDGRWAGLSEVLDAVQKKLEENQGTPVHALKSQSVGAATVHCVAPSPSDLANESDALESLITKVIDGHPITADDGHLLRGRKVDGKGNGLSLALIIEWGDVRVLLGGDVEAPADAARGWRGARSYVAAEGRSDLFDRFAIIKVPHHGSKHAFQNAALGLAPTSHAAAAIVTPFRGGTNAPPHGAALHELRSTCSQLAITSEPACGWSEVRNAQWKDAVAVDGEGASCVVAICDAAGTVSLTTYGGARKFV